MKRAKRTLDDSSNLTDSRIINLSNDIYADQSGISWPSGELNMTLCAGDGIQYYSDIGRHICDIEAFTTGLPGYDREHKPTNIFCCSPSYNSDGLHQNIAYLRAHPELEIVLVLCDTTDPTQLIRLRELFKGRLTRINEDQACYGDTIGSDILFDILQPGGKYILDSMQKIRNCVQDTVHFKYKFIRDSNKLIITKNKILYAGKRNTRKVYKKKSRKRVMKNGNSNILYY